MLINGKIYSGNILMDIKNCASCARKIIIIIIKTKCLWFSEN